MLLSFSEPAMLPMVINGLIKLDVDLLPGVEDWARDHFAAEFEEARDQFKWQTIRDNSRGHWDKAEHGVRLDLWWLSPRTRYKHPGPRTTPRKLAVARVDYTHDVCIEEDSVITVCGVPLYDTEAFTLAYNDGFGSSDELTAWFNLHHGLPLAGKKIVWC